MATENHVFIHVLIKARRGQAMHWNDRAGSFVIDGGENWA